MELYKIEGHALFYEMPKELDHHIAQNLCGELDMLIETHAITELVLDFSKTEFMDSSGIGVIIGRSRTMQFRGGKVAAINMGRRVGMLFDSAGLGKIVEKRDKG